MLFSQRLNQLMEQSGITNYRVSKSLGCSASTVTNWLNGQEPRGEYLYKLAELFSVSTDYLLGKTDIKTPPENPEKKITGYTLNYGGGGQTIELTEKEYKQLLGMLDVIRREQGDQK